MSLLLRSIALVVASCLLAATVLASGATARFLSDDPLSREPETQDAARVSEWEIDLTIDLATNMFASPGDRVTNLRAKNVNTIDEVPDSNWFTNRILARPITIDELSRGPLAGDGPAPGQWTVIAPKLAGFAPGFTMTDTRGERWFVSFDADRPSRSGDRCDCGRQQAVLGAGLLAGRESSRHR